MGLYERYVLSKLTDRTMRGEPFERLRREMLARAKGVVLDVGIGSATSLPFYDSALVELVYALEPSAAMRDLGRGAIEAAPFEVRQLAEGAESISLDDDTVDTAVLAFVLCTIPDPGAALAEIRRVLKPDGMVLYCEHGAANTGGMLRLQRALTPVWRQLAGGCHFARRIPQLLGDAGFALEEEQAGYVQGIPRVGGFVYRGVARADGAVLN